MGRRASTAAGRTGRRRRARRELPNRAGDLDELLGLRPVFRTRLHGYDRAAGRQLRGLGGDGAGDRPAPGRPPAQPVRRDCSAELEISRRLLADAPRGREVFPVSDRVQEMLRLAVGRGRRPHRGRGRGGRAARRRGAHGGRRPAAQGPRDQGDGRRRRRRAPGPGPPDAGRGHGATGAGPAPRRRRCCAQAAASGTGWTPRPRRSGTAADAAAARSWPPCRPRSTTCGASGTRPGSRCARLTDRIGEALQAVAATVPDDMPRHQRGGRGNGRRRRGRVLRGSGRGPVAS